MGDPDDDDDDYPDDLDDGYGEPVGSCDWCGTNLYGNDSPYDGLCDQCAFHASLSEGSEDVGSGGMMPIF